MAMLLTLRGMSVSRVLGLVLEKGLNWVLLATRPRWAMPLQGAGERSIVLLRQASIARLDAK
ncbi:MAG: hypothetical protein ACI9HK_002006 [Pirellulaceae bacterium]|jgi:hypothetical protein